MKTRSSDSDASFVCHSFEAHSRHGTVHPHGGRLQGCRAHCKKQPVHRRHVVGSARPSYSRHSGEPMIVAISRIKDVEETFATADVDAPALSVREKIVGIAA